MTNNLAGIPSIVFGLFGMSLFVNTLGFGDSILAGSLTLGLLTLPVIIRTTEESLKAVDDSFRLGSYALGATKLQTIRIVVLPMAMPNIITGLILSIGRVSGETAPILFTVAAYFLPKLPSGFLEPVRTIPATIAAELGEAPQGGIHYQALFALACILFLITMAINLSVEFIGKKDMSK